YETDFKDRAYKISSALVLALFFVISFSIFTAINSRPAWLNQKTSYPFNPQDKIEDPYLLVFDAFKKGQTHLDIKPDEKLLNLKNPYNPDDRIGAAYYLDYVLYKSKYYSYYGIAPLFIAYYPSYYLSGNLPSMNFAGFILGALAVLALFFAYKSFVKTFLKRTNLVLFILSFQALVCGSLLFVLQADSYRYEFPILSMYIFFALFIAFSFAADGNINNKKFFIYLALAGFSFASILATRPHCIILAFAFIIPLYLQNMFDKNISANVKIKGAVSFFVPFLIICSLVMLHNYARFDSPFSFGQNYNLTGTNAAVSTSQKLSLSNFSAGIFQYFLDVPEFLAHFPFIDPLKHSYNLTGSVFAVGANSRNMGILAFPLFWTLFIGFKNFKTQKQNKLFKSILISTICASIFIAFIGFVCGYPGFRYTCDIRPALAVLSAFIMLACAADFTQDSSSKILYRFFALSCIATIIFGFFMIFNGEMQWIYKINPEIYAKWFNLFSF
ncbi:MAG: hypothetical protein LBO62_00690, partial [Endomicrobium sp.]|nr:hypothetical protein [Endomicrobium sp.]